MNIERHIQRPWATRLSRYLSDQRRIGAAALVLLLSSLAAPHSLALPLLDIGPVIELDPPIELPPVVISPDLVPDEFSLGGGSCVALGEELWSRVTATVRNDGGESEGFNVGFYLSEDGHISRSDRVLLGGREYVSGLAWGETATVPTGMTIPMDLPPGGYYLGMLVDDLESVVESDEANNGRAIFVTVEERCDVLPDDVLDPGLQIEPPIIVLDPPIELPPEALSPDIVAAEFSLEGEPCVAPGEVLTARVTATVRNDGGDSAGFNVGFYLSEDALITRSDLLLLGGRDWVAGLSSGEMEAMDVYMTVPSDTPEGEYTIGMIVDVGDDIAESDESNNTSAVGVTLYASCGRAADLRPGTFSLEGEPCVAPGEELESRLTATVVNVGTYHTDDWCWAVFYLSEDEIITASDAPLLWGAKQAEALAVHEEKDIPTDDLTVPTDLPPGEYYLGVVIDNLDYVDESDESNNSTMIRVTLSHGCGTSPDLRPADLSLEGDTCLEPGESLDSRLSASVENIGDGDSGTFSVIFYLSEDAEITTADLLLWGGVEHVGGLAVASSQVVPTTMSVPTDIPFGEYYLGVICDQMNAIAEGDESNNTRVIPVTVNDRCGIGPDLAAGTFSLSGGTCLEPGESLSGRLTATIHNIGDDISDWSFVGFYLSEDEVITDSDRLLVLGRETADAILAGETEEIATDATIPDDLPPGEYYLGMIVDDLDDIAEANESNNAVATRVTLSDDCDGTSPEIGAQLAADANQDASLDISDVITLLGHLFHGRPSRLPCGDGTIADRSNLALFDLNADGAIDSSDPVYLVVHLFLGGSPPAAGLECLRIVGCPDNELLECAAR